MPAKRYPWEAAGSLRQGQRASAEHALAVAAGELERARAVLEQTREALDALLIARGAGPLAASGETSALDLQRAAAYAQRQVQATRRMRDRLARALTDVDQRTTALQRAQHALAEAHAGERVIDRDRERWQGQQRREHERTEQLEVEEASAPARDQRKR